MNLDSKINTIKQFTCVVLTLNYSTPILTSYPGLLAQAFVTCNTNAGEAW